MIESTPDNSWLIKSGAEKRVRETVNRLLDEAEQAAGFQRRTAIRSPFFGPVTLTLQGAKYPKFSAFARDLSPLGIGLLHFMPLAQGEVIVTIHRPAGGPLLSVRTQIVWCDDCGEGWHVSGGRFIDLVDSGRPETTTP